MKVKILEALMAVQTGACDRRGRPVVVDKWVTVAGRRQSLARME